MRWHGGITVFLALGLSAYGQKVPAPAAGLSAVTAQAVESASREPWRYLLYLPQRYDERPEEKLPLLFYLHGSSGRGKDLAMLQRYGPPLRLKAEPDFPMVMVAPQLTGGGWEPAAVLALVDEVLASYRIDPDRVYLTGVSLGGQGAWAVAAAAPERFAALAPVCGHGDWRSAARFGKLPVWAFHGALDEVVPLEPHRQMVEAVNQAGGSARLTVFEGGDHGNILVPVYGRAGGSRLYDWLLRQRRNQPAPGWTVAEQMERLPGPGGITGPPAPRPGEIWDQFFQWFDAFAVAAPEMPSNGTQAGSGGGSVP